MKYTFLTLAFVAILAVSSFRLNPEQKTVHLLHQMYDSIKYVKTLRMKIGALERIDKKYFTANSEIKLQVLPRKLYFINRIKKLEILYDSEVVTDKAWIKQHQFPYVSLSLDPTGNLMRKNQHYTIHELGYDFIGRSIAFAISKDKDGLNNFNYRGRVSKNGYMCHLLEYENKAYGYTDYTSTGAETITTIANKLCVNDYLIRYRNGLQNEFGSIKKGKVLKVPTLFCKKAVIYLDEKSMLPVSLSLYDDVGLFESYDFSAIEVNPVFRKNEFSKSFPEYGF